MNIKVSVRKFASGLLLAAGASSVFAGPVILGGDDLTDHGSRSGAGVNLQGWKYIELAVGNLLTNQTRGGTITSDIAAIGSSANPSFTGGDAGGAIGSAANVLGKSVAYFDGVTEINQFFADLVSGVINPRVIWLAGTDATNDISAAEGAAITTNAAIINSFVAAGGGIMAHGFGSNAYGWLGALLPGLSISGACNSSGATLTAAGQAAFPSLNNNDIDANAGPCHGSFLGNFGGLVPLALDGNALPFIIGGGANTLIQCGEPGQAECPPQNVPVPHTIALLGIGLVGILASRRRAKVSAA